MEIEKEDDRFESKLDETSRKKAKEELNEINDKDRAIAVQTLRKWTKEQNWLKTPTDFAFLLRFLRVKKFSQLVARKCIENYWTGRTNNPLWFKDVDPADDIVQEILKTGFHFSPKMYDKQGRRVLFVQMGNLGVNNLKERWGIDNLIKAAFLVYDWLLLDENVQVNGLSVVFDYTNTTLQLMMMTMNTDSMKRAIGLFQNALPLRIKAIHWYNEPTFFDAIYQIISPIFKQKIKDRMVLHGKSLVKIYDDVGMSVMLDEYLPDEYKGPSVGKASGVIDEMLADMMKPQFKDYIKEVSSGTYGVDKAKRKVDDTPAESFRKLNVD